MADQERRQLKGNANMDAQCGRCIFRHRNVPGASVEDIDEDRVSANEVAEGMHIRLFLFLSEVEV